MAHALSRRGARGPSAAAAAAAVVALVRPSAAYWDSSLCGGDGDPLCAAPWLHEEAPVLSWAAHPDLCVTAVGGVISLRPCNADDMTQHFDLAAMRGSGGGGEQDAQLRPLAEASSCVAASSSGDGGLSLSVAACGGSSDGASLGFRLPSSGQGDIRPASRTDLCFSVEDSSAGDPPQHAISLRPCDGSDAQRFIAPRELWGSAFVGVNLGGWLVLEEWMWPQEMEWQGIHDEYSLIAKHGGPEDPAAQQVMHNHWDSFVRPEHLDALARFGATHVRIPVGYWLMDSIYNVSDGFVAGGETYLRRVLGWLKDRRMRAVLDLHALPGGQAVDGFTGRRYEEATFFLEEEHYERGKLAVEALADLTLSYEEDAATSGVVMGLELLNEPLHDHWDGPMGIQAFYEEMVPRVRAKLPADKYMLLLSIMDSPHTNTSAWLAGAREADPESFAGVVYDAHIYHLFGDNTAPWTPGQDTCKTCCRDPHLLEPMWSMNVPSVIGEYGLSTGFAGWQVEDFQRLHLGTQLSVWNTTKAVVGSFTWNFRILLSESNPDMYKEWSLLALIDSGYLDEDFVYVTDLTTRCPLLADQVATQCPTFDIEAYWTDPCVWGSKETNIVLATAEGIINFVAVEDLENASTDAANDGNGSESNESNATSEGAGLDAADDGDDDEDDDAVVLSAARRLADSPGRCLSAAVATAALLSGAASLAA